MNTFCFLDLEGTSEAAISEEAVSRNVDRVKVSFEEIEGKTSLENNSTDDIGDSGKKGEEDDDELNEGEGNREGNKGHSDATRKLSYKSLFFYQR